MSLTPPPSLRPALARPAAVLGAGVSGAGAQSLLAALGVDGVVYDVRSGQGEEFTAAAARRHGLVVFSPGFPPGHPWLARARAAGAVCLGELEFAARFWRGRVIAVTGTNGKTTLTELLTHALGTVGRRAYATGNIGASFSRLVADRSGGNPDDDAICEVSSFQAETFEEFRADATLWTNFAEDHLERHPGLEAYFDAKWRLVEQTFSGKVFAGSSVVRFARGHGRPAHRLVPVASEERPADPRLAGTVFAQYPQRENFLLAAAWWRADGRAEEELIAAARTFAPGRHRLDRVAMLDGVSFWNDSKATNFHAVEAALGGFPGPVILIAGGRAKGGDVAGFVRRIAPRVKHAVLIGETSAALAAHFGALQVAHTCCSGLPEAVRRAATLAVPGDHVLLSPGFASFDQFRNYQDRGDQFEHLVGQLPLPAGNLG
ncbi:MAG: UDP-N-acetylmuramoyl-L-alanine--D-glutamate ligase [Opitutaceae bacterium]|nr:UDP-N-acetylmuramoyl-L-alanine--D-glutamate ligase [Opitutaceae bacterium]